MLWCGRILGRRPEYLFVCVKPKGEESTTRPGKVVATAVVAMRQIESLPILMCSDKQHVKTRARPTLSLPPSLSFHSKHDLVTLRHRDNGMAWCDGAGYVEPLESHPIDEPHWSSK